MSIPKKFLNGKRFIAKIQTPLASNEVRPLAMVYNEERDYDVMMEITPELLDVMEGWPKKYFWVHYDAKTNNTVIEEQAPTQAW